MPDRALMPTPGPIGHNLIANVERLKQERRLSDRRLSAMLLAIGRPIPPLGLSRMAKCERRVDVDELVALAEVLAVAPAALLTEPCTAESRRAAHPAIQAATSLMERIEQLLQATGGPGKAEGLSGYVDRALRRLQVEVEELIAETGKEDSRPTIPDARS